MNNLLKFLSKYYASFLFVFLQLIAVFLIIQNNSYHKAGFLNASNSISGGIYSIFNNASIYIDLKNQNQKLSSQNALLQSKLRRMEYILIPPLKEDTLAVDTLITDTLNDFKYLPALVINNSTNKRLNYIYINKGKIEGVEKDMGVFGLDGVVGVVVNASNNYSIVMPLINEKSNVSVSIKKLGYFGTLQWKRGDPAVAEIKEIPNHVQLEKGDTIVSSGYSKIFPMGKLVGYVLNAERNEGQSSLNIEIKLAENFSNLSYAYVLINNKTQELKDLKID